MAAHSAMEKLHAMVATSAIYDGERDEKDDYTRVCHPGTREDHLRDLATWADNAPSPPPMRVEWYNAIAGAGKTAMMRTFCTELEARSGTPPVSFFIWKGDGRRNTLKHFPATISAQLCRSIPVVVPHVVKAINEDPFLLQSTFGKQMDKLVIGPLLDACNAIKEERHLIIVVDGLDELDEKGLSDFLSFVPNFISRLSSLPISLLVSSRPDAQIVAAFNHPRLASITKATRLGASDEDIWKFINEKFDDINIRYPHLQIECGGGMWPSHAKRAIMVKQSSGLFIWPTVAIDYIDKVALGLTHNKRLEQVLSSAEPKPWITSPLDNLYRAILQAHAPEDPEDLLRFRQWLAYLCLPVSFGKFVSKPVINLPLVDYTDTPIRVVFGEALDELWDSVAGLSSLFSPRKTLSRDESPTPGISHLSLRDFTFNRVRCGDKFYYSSEKKLHTEVVCKLFEFLNTRQAYQNCAGMSAKFIRCIGEFLGSHLDKAAVSERLGRCMDDVMLDYIPSTWPLVTQIYVIVKLFDGLYKLADIFDFPDGSQRREAFLSKLTVFFKTRAKSAEEWDVTLFRLALSSTDFQYITTGFHSVQCWHISRSPKCTCLDALMRNIDLDDYQRVLRDSALFQRAKSLLLPDSQVDVARDSLVVLKYFLSLSETSPRAAELSSFVLVRSDCWIQPLLQHCSPNEDLYNSLGLICTAPLPDLPKREEDSSKELVEQFLDQTDKFNKYTERCRKVGIKTQFPPIEIPDDWWEDDETRTRLLDCGYKPSFDIPDDWWEDDLTSLLGLGFKPSFTFPDYCWEDAGDRCDLLGLGLKPSFDIPDDWWEEEDTRNHLLKQGYVRPTPKSPSIISNFDFDIDASASDVDDDAPLPATLPAEELIVSEANPTPASDMEDTQTTLQTDIASQPVVSVIPVPDSASVEQTTASGVNGSVSDAGAQPEGHRRRRVKSFFNRFFHKP